MVDDSENHQRRSIRLTEYDYSLPGAYFVTLVCYGRASLFGEIKKGNVEHNDIGRLVNEYWLRMPDFFDNTKIDEFILMPNHLHGIVIIHEAPGKGEAFAEFNSGIDDTRSANASPLRQVGTQSGSLGSIIQNFKSVSTRVVNREFFEKGNKLWQRNYFERIIRNERELNAIRQYIRDNPYYWELDKENPAKV